MITIICINLQNRNADIIKSSRFRPSSSNFVVNDLDCTGAEHDLDECRSYPWDPNSYSCPHNERNAAINCSTYITYISCFIYNFAITLIVNFNIILYTLMKCTQSLFSFLHFSRKFAWYFIIP